MGDFKIIEGEFEPKEAKEIILNIVDGKIRFHKLRNFSHEERFGTKDLASEKRLAELTILRNELTTLLEGAEGAKQRLKISSKISIESVLKEEMA